MSLRYYIKNILFGLYCTLIYIYLITKNNEGYYFLASDKMLYAIVISTILCPYSKYAIEHIFFKFIKKDFFRKRVIENENFENSCSEEFDAVCFKAMASR